MEGPPMSTKLMEISAVICYLGAHCEGNRETLLGNKSTRTVQCLSVLNTQTHTY